MVNVRNKGKRGELEIKSSFILTMETVERDTGISGVSHKVKRNTLQSDRGGDDIVGIPFLSIEVKRQETLSINTWWQQCIKSAKEDGLMPVLIYRQNRKSWTVRTWVMLHHPSSDLGHWAVGEVSFGEFLQFFAGMYRSFLLGQDRA